MNSSFLKYLYLAAHLTSQVHLSLLSPTKLEKDIFRFDLNQLPPDESLITPDCSTSSAAHPYGSSNVLELKREKSVEIPTMPSSSMLSKEFGKFCKGDHVLHGEEVKPSSVLLNTDFFPNSHKRKSEDSNLEHRTHKFHCGTGGEKQPTFPYNKKGKNHNNGSTITEFLNTDHSKLCQTNEVKSERSKEKSNQNQEVEFKQEEEKPLHLNHWSFVKVDPDEDILKGKEEKSEELQPDKKLFKHLNGMRSDANPEEGFWIPRGDQINFFKNYYTQRKNLVYPPKIICFHRKSGILYIILRISQEKLDLDQYFGFFKELEKQLILNLESNKSSFVRLDYLNNPLSIRMEYMKKLTRITTTLTLIYISLFREHEGGSFKKMYILNHLNFFKELWEDVLNLSNEGFFNQNEFAKQLHETLNYKTKRHINDSKMSNAAELMRMSWHIFDYWLKNTGRGSKTKSGKIKNRKAIVEIIQKIIFWSNSQSIFKLINCGLH
ncbi:hypothetical protein PGT21_026744 [Puccinia graminis f. sp. tritici]|uniref:Uncharacterized protein n=1 Tax=Puccinia graminis f. sp. tritici TaxID=56615 RepID=A0A5B0MNT4_PUCGR|nr:hypothetical protein PGT21_026744 [Puccinia graminis f. sp. tritici]KAA1103690.1 hypothetical protein PGTUg99_004743 [Puccinia graminis f. sp. tritici]